MSTIQNLFEQAQLAEAAYADFAAYPNDPIKALQVEGFSTAQAADFVTHWRVVDQYTTPSGMTGLSGSGFSATVFEKLDANGNGTGQYSQVGWAKPGRVG